MRRGTNVLSIGQIVAAIQRLDRSEKPILIAVEGFGGSGKTTFARRLADALGSAYVVSMDDFLVMEKLAEPSWDTGVFDRERLERQVLRPASLDQPIRYQKLLWDTNTLSDPITIPAVDYLIVEGISAYHPTIERYYRFKIWMATPLNVAQARGHARDGANANAAYWDIWARNDSAYQRQYHPDRRADAIFKSG